MHMKSDENGHPRCAPRDWRHRGHFWYTAQLLSFMLQRPNKRFEAILQDAKDAAGWGAMRRPLLSLHVRRGDSCTPEQEESKKRRCEPLSAYMEKAVLPIAKKYGVRSIYLATDDEATAQEARAEWPEFVWLVAEGMDRGAVKSVAKWEANLRRGVMDNHLEAQNALIDLLLLAEGDAFVGKFTSNLDRIAFALLAARAKGLVPYVSLDSQWCSDWARAAGSSIYGTFYC
mmetsp:Transcript_17605/g.40423  ORF Transcript_17605/g.40423 Transcript_17605/m.40423 type:complete len:230 (-) Transcript_17605:290-979(-)